MQPASAGLPSGSFGGRVRRGGPGPGPWRAQRLLSSPHRLGFLAGALMLAASALWWAAVLAARHAGLALPFAVSPTSAHALWMAFGFLPLFIVGFLFTAGPRWLQVAEVPAAELVAPVAAMVTGWGLALLGFHLSAPLAALGLAVVAAGMALANGCFGLLLLQSRVADRDHAKLVWLGNTVSALALWFAAAALALGHDALVRAAVQVALWGGFGLVFVTVAHRMIPFFTVAALPSLDAWRPRALLGLLALLVAVQAPFAAVEAYHGTLGPLPAGLRAAVELAAGALLLWLALRWGLVQSLGFAAGPSRADAAHLAGRGRKPVGFGLGGKGLRLLAMLHMGFFWLGVAFTLGGVSHALMSATDGQLTLGLAPLHAFTMGYLGSTLFAMATRVACGHSGRTLVADDWAWAMFWALQAAVVMRLGAALVPAHGGPLTLLAAQFWLAAALAWALRYGRWFGRPRADGRPG